MWRVALGFLGAQAIFAAVTWFTLPSRIPIHFGLNGRADAWTDRSLFFWFILTLVPLGLQMLIRLLSSHEAYDSWNIPEKERFLNLKPEQRKPVIALLQLLGAYSAVAATMVFFGIQIGTYLAAKGITRGLPWYILVIAFAPVACLLIGLIPWSKAVERSILEATRGAEEPA